ncbi:hypothetical protein FOZ61_000734 [Perkinsus olseni]|uniref:Uncharacterized protein n=1 Tax=Perkinsus olseni TaxID=32597 RepID=A0A7J6KSI8_PEROL|nr:hypothetical protein FOZ61_000734 [Perkinsus olseni]
MDSLTFDQFKQRDFAELAKAGFAGNLKQTLGQLTGNREIAAPKADLTDTIADAIDESPSDGLLELGDEIKKAEDFGKSREAAQDKKKSS